jgi:hypothetical protein
MNTPTNDIHRNSDFQALPEVVMAKLRLVVLFTKRFN